MIVYVDSSALVKRVVIEPESDALETALERHRTDGDDLVSSALAWVEVERALRFRLAGDPDSDPAAAAFEALAGVGEAPVGSDVISLARRVGPSVLRTLDAIHVATAILVDADEVLAYDDRLLDAVRDNGLRARSPGR